MRHNRIVVATVEDVMEPLVVLTPQGLYCPQGDFYIDPCRSVEKALITHAHGDHAFKGSKEYFCTAGSLPMLEHRLGRKNRFIPVAHGEPLDFGTTRVSFHPAGHILGSAQIRIESGNQVWVVSGDYKRSPDPTCEPFEVVPCDTFISEATFGLPIYKWPGGAEVAREIMAWWESNQALGKASVLFCYALGKAQRILAELGALTSQPVYVHESMVAMIDCYRQQDVSMLETCLTTEHRRGASFAGELILAPPWAKKTFWMRQFYPCETAFASGWMRVRATRNRSGYDKGFVISDHADWNELTRTVAETGAKKVLTMHGSDDTLVRYLRQAGYDAASLSAS